MTIVNPTEASRKPNPSMVVGSSSFHHSSTLKLVKAALLLRRIEAVRAKDSNVSAKAVIVNQVGEVLVLFPNQADWVDLPGGHIHDGEDAVTGLVREVREETGISIGDIKSVETVSFKDFKGKPRTTLLFKATALSFDVRISDEHEGFRWVKPSELAGFKLGYLAEPVMRTLNPVTISAAEATGRFMTEAELVNHTHSHHETVRRVAERAYRATIDDWLSFLLNEITASDEFWGQVDDYDGIWFQILDNSMPKWQDSMSATAASTLKSSTATLARDAGAKVSLSKDDLESFASLRKGRLEAFPKAVREKVSASLKRGLAGGEDARALARRLNEVFEEIKTGAANRVASTEAQVTYGVSQSKALEAAGYRLKRWVTVGDDRVRDSHYLCESQGGIPHSSPFHNGLMFPGDPNGGPEEVINCRCNLEGVI